MRVILPYCRMLISITEPVGAKAPTFSGDAKGSWFVKLMGQSFGLLCQAQGFPVPAFR